MPTGYTDKIKDGQSFDDFVLKCTRAFGATIMQRDEPMSQRPKLRQPSEYGTKRLDEARQRTWELTDMDQTGIDKQCAAAHKQALESWERLQEGSRQTRAAYIAMQDLVITWVPPSPDHVEFKEFMLKQIADSIKWDCHDYPRPTELSPSEWYAKELGNAVREAENSEEAQAKEKSSADGANDWISAVYQSLDMEVPA